MGATEANGPKGTLLARYTDVHGRPHRIVLRRHVAVDLCTGEPPRLVTKLALGEGEAQARALLDGSEIDEGYIARARREGRPFIRALTLDDVRGPVEADASDDEAAEEPPLAA